MAGSHRKGSSVLVEVILREAASTAHVRWRDVDFSDHVAAKDPRGAPQKRARKIAHGTLSPADAAHAPQMGDPAVGKSALTQMFHSNGQRFPKAYNMTCGVDFSAKAVKIPNTEPEEAVELHIFYLILC